MQITSWYTRNFEDRLKGRYITINHILPLLDHYREVFNISVAGFSENGVEIPLVSFGQGGKKVLIWSQMHGNESTTTKALFDFFKFITSNKQATKDLLSKHTFYVLPMLNPDGAALYTRENTNGVDLNRDAQTLSQPESKVLKSIFDALQPDLCLNMHDQRSIFGIKGPKPATLSFLAPSADILKTITPAREVAMGHIVKMNNYIKAHHHNQIGRFDDTYNQHCVGDSFTSSGVPTILFEAGHFKDDYSREQSRSFVFYALIALFDLDAAFQNKDVDYKEYFNIPENQKIYKDVVLYNVRVDGEDTLQTISFQYKEIIHDQNIVFELYFDAIEVDKDVFGHQYFDLQGGKVLVNSHQNIVIDKKISTIFDINRNLMLI
ncbi:M14 family zinc carboxypeptidase [Flavobacteriaceae bacterium]|nr:M14 family zinc carboxypeptidase [Flavobacteriaceae bacterium]MDC1373256.1 M14 family zinc carboxypeptidase [Flavobacteriaceae bacterium]